MNTPPFDVEKARRWFAADSNNRAWDLLERKDRSLVETERLVHAAHAACHHWLDAGTAVNHVRALQLLAVVYAEVERPAESLRYAQRGLELARAHAAELADWDLPLIYEACARAHAAAGDRTAGRQFLTLAEQSTRVVADIEDRRVCWSMLASRNWFGLDDIVTLADADSGAFARVHVGFGFNCFDLQLPVAGQTHQVLWSAPGFESGTERPSGSGVPLLYPFPGRIAQGRFTWDGRSFEIPPTDNRGNAIHGFVLNRPWRLVERSATRVVGEFQGSIDAPELAERWPADYAIRATYELSGARFVMRYECWNPDQKPLPCGFGSHPYFRLPLAGGASANDCLVSLPVAAEWELVELLPTGAQRPVADAAAVQSGRRFGDLTLDNAFTALQFDGDWSTARLRDPQTGRQLAVSFDRAFRECVVYTPPHREAICIEPLTCVPGAILLEPRGIDAGLRVLQPGERMECAVAFELSASS